MENSTQQDSTRAHWIDEISDVLQEHLDDPSGLSSGIPALLDGPVARMIADAEQAVLRAAEWRMFGTTDGDSLDDDGDLPVGEMRRLLWLPHPQGGTNAEQVAERRGAERLVGIVQSTATGQRAMGNATGERVYLDILALAEREGLL